MSLGVTGERRIALRALAHPLRLRMLSLLTGAPLSAAELARELDVSQALASYHLRRLHAAGAVEAAGEGRNRGGRERRYRYRPPPLDGPLPDADDDAAAPLFVEAACGEARRRSIERAPASRGLSVDAELWLAPDDWVELRDRIATASVELHERARPPHDPGAVRVNATVLLFELVAAVRRAAS